MEKIVPKDRDVNLLVLEQFKKLFNIEIGYSHHSFGDLALLIAYAKGANILEFHFTESRKDKVFRDHFISLTKDEVQSLSLKLKRIKSILGNNNKTTLKSEIRSGHSKSFRRGIFFNKDIKKGTIIKSTDLTCLRPNQGLDARNINKILGKKSPKNFKALEKIII